MTRRTPLLFLVAALAILSPGAVASTARLSVYQSDCTFFVYQEEAQRYYESVGRHFAKAGIAVLVDPDGDGIACSELLSRTVRAQEGDRIPAAARPARVSEFDDAEDVALTVEFLDLDLQSSFDTLLLDIEPIPDTDAASGPGCAKYRMSVRLAATSSSLHSYDDRDDPRLWLEEDPERPSNFEPLERWVWFEGITDDGPYLLNELLVREGSARVRADVDDSIYTNRLRTAQEAAQAEDAGLWGDCADEAATSFDDLATASVGAVTDAVTREFSGSGDTVTGPFRVPGGPLVVEATYQGERNFAVWAYYGDNSRELLFNEIGPYAGQAVLDADGPTEVVLEVQATGPWTITLRPAFSPSGDA